MTESESQERIAREVEMRAEAHRVLEKEFVEPLRDVLEMKLPSRDGGGFRLGEILERNIGVIKSAESEAERVMRQKACVSELVSAIKELPSDSWSCSTRQLKENMAANCSSAASLLTIILEQLRAEIGIDKPEYANPKGHCINIVGFDDGTTYYVDPRNGIFEDVTQRITVEDQPNMRLYILNDPEPKMPHRYYPVLKKQHDLIVGNYLSNMAEVPRFARGEIYDDVRSTIPPDDLQMMQAEAQAAQQREAITDVVAEKYKETAEYLMAPVLAFHESERGCAEFKVIERIK